METQSNELINKIHPILKAHDVKRASLFGSFARGDEARESDIDIIIEFNGTKSLFDLVRLKFDLEEQLARSVDVLTYDSLNPLIKQSILAEQVVIYG